MKYCKINTHNLIRLAKIHAMTLFLFHFDVFCLSIGRKTETVFSRGTKFWPYQILCNTWNFFGSDISFYSQLNFSCHDVHGFIPLTATFKPEWCKAFFFFLRSKFSFRSIGQYGTRVFSYTIPGIVP